MDYETRAKHEKFMGMKLQKLLIRSAKIKLIKIWNLFQYNSHLGKIAFSNTTYCIFNWNKFQCCIWNSLFFKQILIPWKSEHHRNLSYQHLIKTVRVFLKPPFLFHCQTKIDCDLNFCTNNRFWYTWIFFETKQSYGMK